MIKKQNIALMCGGESSECEVSINSALNVLKHIDTEKFIPYLVFIGRTNWYVVKGEEFGFSYGDAEFTSEDVMFAAKDYSYANLFSSSDSASAAAQHVKLQLLKVDQTEFGVRIAEEKECKCDDDGGFVKFDKALVMVHGRPGENGLLQGYLEMKKVPFFSCSSYVSAITFDKHSCKRFLDFAGVKMGRDMFIRQNVPFSKREIIRQIGLPMFVKPTVGGSSFGVSKVKSEADLDAALEAAFEECPMILAEEAIAGREFTCGVYSLHGKVVKLPVTEIVTHREFFDYEAKYLGESEEICPASISLGLSTKIQNLSEHIYNYMGCSGIVRMDYIVTPSEDVYFLEVNTIPGMTRMSLVPKMLEVAGIDLKGLLTELLESC